MNYGAMVYSFEYNDSGIRTSKTVNGIEHVYTLNGSQIVTESWVQNGVEYFIVYLYDESGAPIGMQYRTSNYAWAEFDNFYFEKNLFGDIVAIYNEAGTKIGYYKYDAWGVCTASVESTASTFEKKVVRMLNPFRYRGYYYDTETGLYYLQSRYYNPQWGRFLNVDGYINANGDLIGFNMYAYCSNNPIMYTDPSGTSIITIIVAGVIIGLVVLSLSSCSDPDIPEPEGELSTGVGAAQKYRYSDGNTTDPQNCYTYAINMKGSFDPGSQSRTKPAADNDVDAVATAVIADLNSLGRSARIIDGPNDPIYDNEYRIALRVGTNPFQYVGNIPLYDYHFMVQTATGQWAEKHGTEGTSILHPHGLTPDDLTWTLYGEEYYDSKIIYFAISD